MAEGQTAVRTSPRLPADEPSEQALRVGDEVSVDRKFAVGEGGLATVTAVPDGPDGSYAVKYAAGRSEKGLARSALQLQLSASAAEAGEKRHGDGVATRSKSAEDDEVAEEDAAAEEQEQGQKEEEEEKKVKEEEEGKMGKGKGKGKEEGEEEEEEEEHDDEDEDDEDEDDEIFEVRKITGKRVLEKAGKGILQYKVRWRGFGPEADTWEPLDNLATALDLVSDHEVKLWRVAGSDKTQQSEVQYRGADGRAHITGRTLWTPQEDAELAQLVHEHGVIGAWDEIAEAFSVGRTGNALSKRWSKIRDQWQDADSAAASAIASSRRKKRQDRADEEGAPLKKQRGEAEDEGDGLSEGEWLAAVDVGDDVEVRDRQSWYACKVVVSEEQRVKIHFVGCGRRYDRWVQRSSDFLRRRSPPQEASSEEEEVSDDDDADADRTEDAQLSHLVRKYKHTDDEFAVGGWTLREDLELADAVRKTGPRDWVGKQSMLSHSRSANAIRKRWAKLEEDAETMPVAGDDRVRVWNKKEQRMLAGASAPLEKNLQRYLREHPDMEVYAGQNQSDSESGSGDDEFDVPPTPAWLKSVESGTKLEARDRTGWYEAKVIAVEKARVKIHYIGFATKYDVWTQRDLDWLRPLSAPKQPARSRSTKAGASSDLATGRAALLHQVAKLRQMYADTSGYSKTCPDCGRTFSHPPAWASHMGSRLCKEESQAKQQQNAKQGSRPRLEPTAPARSAPTLRAELPDSDPRSWSAEEDRALLQLVRSRGAADWATRAAEFPYNRSMSAIRKRWFKLQEDAADSMVSARRRAQQQKEQQRQSASTASLPRRPPLNRSFDQFADPPEVSKAKSVNKAPPGWTKEEDAELRQLVAKLGVGNWGAIEAKFSSDRSSDAVRKRWHYVLADSSDNEEDATATSAKQPVATAASKWTVDEDLELVRLVKKHDTSSGSWEPMAEIFCRKFEGSTRSGGSLRGRWQRLEEEAAAAGTTVLDMRISLWHKNDQVAIKGENAPRREDLRAYLSEHTEVDIYTGQDGQLQPKATVDSLGRSSWTAEEDAQLTELVKKHGVGNWHAVGADLTSSRSSDSLRHRWTKLEKYAKAAKAAKASGAANDDVAPKVEEGNAETTTSVAARVSAQLHETANAGGGWSKGTPDSLGRTLWTAAEDANLVQLVKKHGAGNWDPIESDFSTNRSADALRKRWVKLQAPARSVRQSDSASGSNEVSRLGLGLPGQREMISATGRIRKAVHHYDPVEIGRAAQSAHAADSSRAGMDQVNVSRSGRMRKAVETFVPGDITEIEAKQVDTQQNVSEERVVMWNTITQRKVAGNSAPRRAHLQQYLQDHPEYEVYTDQNLPGSDWLKPPSNVSRSPSPVQQSPKTFASSAEDDARTAWGALEDAELARLVREDGTGSWATKASVFSTGRSASAIRMRWIKLEEDAEQAGTTAGEMRIRVWNRKTQRLTAGNSAPRRENLERFLQEHPDYIVHNDPGGTKSGGPPRAAGSPGKEEETRSFWTTEEDAELSKLVKNHGVGDWVGKAARFSSTRSADSLRKRWLKLEDEEKAKQDEGQERVRVWNTRTRRALAGMSAPRRENLKRYLSEHPEMEIYDGQDQVDVVASRDGSAQSRDCDSVPEERNRTYWTDEEDEELAKLVAKRAKFHLIICFPMRWWLKPLLHLLSPF